MQQKIILGLILIFINQSIFSQTIHIKSPKYIILNTNVEMQIEGKNLPDSILIGKGKFALINKKNKTLIVKNYTETPIFNSKINFTPPKGEIPLWLSILPPLFAIILALIFKEVTYSLFAGIFIGSAIIAIYLEGWIGIFTGFLRVLDTYIINALNDSDHLSVILFSLLIGSLVAVISKNGGMAGVVKRMTKFAKTRKSGQFATFILGVAIFFDDYANTLVVGNTMKSVTDKLKISREKLAYIVDSTAAPVAAIALVTTWIGAELDYISGGLDKINVEVQYINKGVYSIFINSIAYSFYPIFTLMFILILIWKQKDFGPMLRFERKSIEEKSQYEESEVDEEIQAEINTLNPKEGIKIRSFNAIIPILVVVFGTVFGLFVTGFDSIIEVINTQKISFKGVDFVEINSWSQAWSRMELIGEYPQENIQKIGEIIGKADSYKALLWSSLSALFVALVLSISQKTMSIEESMKTIISGFKTMLPAMIILILAWSLAGVTNDLHTADYIKNVFGNNFSPIWIPTITFLLAAIIAFSTGSSWSTMSIIYPIMLPAAFGVCLQSGYSIEESMNIFYITVSSVLAGAVLGDHCSPISDTTILSSLATNSNHINHVKSQMPYALTVGGVAIVFGLIPAAMGISSFITVPIGLIILYLIIQFFGKKVSH